MNKLAAYLVVFALVVCFERLHDVGDRTTDSQWRLIGAAEAESSAPWRQCRHGSGDQRRRRRDGWISLRQAQRGGAGCLPTRAPGRDAGAVKFLTVPIPPD